MKPLHRRRAVGRAYGQPTWTSPLGRVCSKCEAKPGQACQRYVGDAINGTGYWKSLVRVHVERRTKRGDERSDE